MAAKWRRMSLCRVWCSSIFVGGRGVEGAQSGRPSLSDASTMFLQSAPSRQATRATELLAGRGEARVGRTARKSNWARGCRGFINSHTNLSKKYLQAFIHLSISWCHDTDAAIAFVFSKSPPESSFWQQMAKSRETTCAKELPSLSFRRGRTRDLWE